MSEAGARGARTEPSVARRLLRRAAHSFAHRLYARIAKAGDRVYFHDVSLEIAPSVFHPRLTLTSKVLAGYLETIELRGSQLLDMGCGSGILGCVAARQGADVTAVDINPVAVECTLRSARANRLQDRIRVLHSDLFGGLPAETRYDHIVWNPPFYAKEPTDDASRAWNAGSRFEVIDRFARQAAGRLRPEGNLIIILSTDTDVDAIVGGIASYGFTPRLAVSRKRFFETLKIYEFTIRTGR
jgi:release factor glutamine methyltransferase